MKKWLPTLTLRVIALLFAAADLSVCILAPPWIGDGFLLRYPGHAFWLYPMLFCIYASAGSFLYALAHCWLLLRGVDRHDALILDSLKAIRKSSIACAVLYYLPAIPLAFLLADAYDAPYAIRIAAALGIFPIAAAAVAAVLERAEESG
jgi:hypothetical protein